MQRTRSKSFTLDNCSLSQLVDEEAFAHPSDSHNQDHANAVAVVLHRVEGLKDLLKWFSNSKRVSEAFKIY
jgi:hypothetical protein